MTCHATLIWPPTASVAFPPSHLFTCAITASISAAFSSGVAQLRVVIASEPGGSSARPLAAPIDDVDARSNRPAESMGGRNRDRMHILLQGEPRTRRQGSAKESVLPRARPRGQDFVRLLNTAPAEKWCKRLK